MNNDIERVLITKEEHYTDRYADLVIHDKVCDVLPQLISKDLPEKKRVKEVIELITAVLNLLALLVQLVLASLSDR